MGKKKKQKSKHFGGEVDLRDNSSSQHELGEEPKES